jgi:MFS family permease
MVIVGLALLATDGLNTQFFPTIFFAYFAIGLGIGSSFTPLLTIAMANVPAADAGLGSGIVNVSQQVAGAFGLAVLGTIAANHSKALEAHGHTVASSLIAGYHLAFTIGAGSIVVAIITTFVVLRPLGRRAPAATTVSLAPARAIAPQADPALERQAA